MTLSPKAPDLSVSRHEAGGLLVETNDGDDTKWVGQRLGDKRILLTHEDAKQGFPPAPSCVATCPIELFRDFLVGLNHAGWSGMVAVDTGYGLKKIYFSRGDIVFAGSNIMDDRLGEVIYREAKITLDELTNSAAQVTKVRKFGQVLISSGIFTNVELWVALKLQVKQILRSVFMVDRVYFEMQTGLGLAPTEVIFQESVPELTSECYSYGSAFRAFLGKLRVESEVELLPGTGQKDMAPGSFASDLLALISQQSNVQELLDASKLIDLYTVAALFHLANQGILRILPETEDGPRPPQAAQPLKAKIDAYGYVLQQVRKAFADAGKDFPALDVQTFAANLNPEGFPSLFLDTSAQLGRDCVSGIFSQCAANASRVGYFMVRLESLIQFLLQVAGDSLAFQTASKIRQDYRAVSS